jgi:hypothetical protein
MQFSVGSRRYLHSSDPFLLGLPTLKKTGNWFCALTKVRQYSGLLEARSLYLKQKKNVYRDKSISSCLCATLGG